MPRRRTPHRVDDYARSVLAGDIVAGPYVRLACARQERDRADARAKGFTFSAAAADHAIGFIERWVHLPDVLDKRGHPLRFLLQPLQAFIVGSLFGWKFDTGYRRFRNRRYPIPGEPEGTAQHLERGRVTRSELAT